MDLLIKNIRIIDPGIDLDEIGDILVRNGTINKLGTGISCENAEIIDGTGLTAMPGLVDAHVHFRDPGQTHKEDIHTGALASAAGGYTSVVMMANTVPTIDCPEVLQDVLERGSKENIHIYSAVNATKGMQGKEIIDYAPLKKMGAAIITDDGKPILDEELFREICKKAREINLPLSLHEEDPKYISENGVNSGSAAAELGLTGSDRMAEISIIDRDIKIAKEEKVTLCIQHISTKEGVELVRCAKKAGADIHAEATPHHFSITDDAVKIHGTLAKMNPPLRKHEDMIAVREGLADGTIDMIATDHAPHSVIEKSKPFKEAPSGIIGLETALPLAITNLVDTGYLSMIDLAKVLSLNAAKLYSLPAGTLSEGANADIVIFDANEEFTVGKTFASKSVNSPFIGSKLKGKIKYTICDGKIVFKEDGK